ncbi:MAG: hypothetical protein CMD29_02120 [Flavobacteriales bacterium]|nr:hypothetical protein [Flavobacteriales bacterium]|tara:strand:+ start:759 stop:1706 length:948 start_codon:yes stop_codon:yes gene_type:complete
MDNISFITVFLISVVFHFIIQKLFIYLKKFDDFNHRSIHNTLATRTGGIGLFMSLLTISLYNYFQGIDLFDYSFFIPLGIMFIVGVYDDFYNADFKLKFLLQIIVSKILIDQGYVINNYHGLFGIYEVPWLLAQASTIFVFLIIVNSINFIDGIDGLAISEIIKTILFVEFLSVKFTPLAPMGMIIIASILPLYYFNFKEKQKIFLGDGGSLLLGTTISIYIFYVLGSDFTFKDSFELNKTLFAVLILLYPLTDLFRVFIIRIKEKKSPFVADQNHLHHIINKRLQNQKLTLLLISTLSILIPFVIYKIVSVFDY